MLAEAETAGATAARVYRDLVGRLRRAAPGVKDLRLELEEPAPRKEIPGVFECWATLKAVVPHDLTHMGPDNHLDAWRAILRDTFQTTSHLNHELVPPHLQRVGVTHGVFPYEEEPRWRRHRRRRSPGR